MKFGYDGIVFAVDASAGEWKLEPKTSTVALRRRSAEGRRACRQHCQDLEGCEPGAPREADRSLHPGREARPREVFEEKVLHAGCKAAGADKLQHSPRPRARTTKPRRRPPTRPASRSARTRVAVDIDGDYTETLARIQSNKDGVGVFGLSFYEQNTDKLKVASVSGVVPSLETVASGKYPVSRPRVLLREEGAPRRHSGLKEYAEFFTSDKMLTRSKARWWLTASSRSPTTNSRLCRRS